MLRLAAACAAALLSAAPAGAHTDSGSGLSLVWPASGTETRGFGYDGPSFHPGIDIGSLLSLDITSAAPGTVEATSYVSHFDGYGNIVLVDLGGGMEALYAHLSEVDVKQGDAVQAGEKLGVARCPAPSFRPPPHFPPPHHRLPLHHPPPLPSPI